MEHGGEKRRELWSMEESIKSLGNRKKREAGSTGARRREEKGALEQGGAGQGLGDEKERGEGSTGARRRGEKGALEHVGEHQELWE